MIACIEDPAVIDRILTHVQQKAISDTQNLLPPSRAPPVGLFD